MLLQSYIYKIKYNRNFNNYTLLFRNNIDSRMFALYLNSFDAKNISLAKNNIKSKRLTSFAMFMNMLNLFNVNIEQILITTIKKKVSCKIIFINNKLKYELYVALVDAVIISLNSFVTMQIKDKLFDMDIKLYLEDEKFMVDNRTNKIDSLNTIETLNNSLRNLIKNENYESAAVIRDKIFTLKSKK